MAIFVTSDTHFGHRNIIVFEKEKRPFATIEQHDEALIANWNETVTDQDEVWHLGDIAFNSKLNLLSQLNGKLKYLVMGNHDMKETSEYLKYFYKIKPVLEMKEHGLIFTHYPLHPSQLDYRYRFNVHGHTHGKIFVDQRYFNVCVENTNLRPIALDEIIAETQFRQKLMETD